MNYLGLSRHRCFSSRRVRCAEGSINGGKHNHHRNPIARASVNPRWSELAGGVRPRFHGLLETVTATSSSILK